MASIPATITVNFTSNYAGPHRVCWRIGNSGPYNCTTIVSCGGSGQACQAILVVSVDNETCDDVTFNGYVQAACEVDGSNNGRVPFSETFTPDPSCKGYTLTCNSVSLARITMTNPGAGYNTPPNVVISGGGGSGATATAQVGNAGVFTTSLTNAGTGYTNGTYNNVVSTTLTGSGSGAQFNVVVAGGIVVSAVLIFANAGTGYVVADTLSFNASDIGGTGSGVVITVDSVNTGKVLVTLTSPGSGYTSVPTVTVDPAIAGTTATAIAVLAPCPNQLIGNNCNGSTREPLSLNLGNSTKICNASAPPSAVTGISIAQDTCCYDCRSYNITKAVEQGNALLTYTNCENRVLVRVSIASGYNSTICAVEGSVLVQEIDGGTTVVTPGAVCP